MNNQISFLGKLKVLLLSVLALASMYPYFWWNNYYVIFASSVFLIFVFFLQLTEYRRIDQHLLLSFVLFIFVYDYIFLIRGQDYKIISVIWLVLTFFLPVVICLFSDKYEKKKFLEVFSTVLAVILCISFLFYILNLLGFWNSFSRIYPSVGSNYKYFDNYRFFIKVYDNRSLKVFPRFQSVFTEPGHLGMILALLLYVRHFDIKRVSNWIFIISAFFSFSLASYVLLITGFFIHTFFSANNKKTTFFILIFIALILSCITLSFYKKNPDSVLGKLVISRLMPNETKGINGNNRNTVEFNAYYDEVFSEFCSRFFLGEGNGAIKNRFPNGGNSSYKNFILQYGVLGILLLFLFYFSLCRSLKTGITYGLLFLYSMSFLQRPYALWASELFLFITSIDGDFCDYIISRAKVIN